VQIVIADHGTAAPVLYAFKLEAPFAVELASIGNSLLDRRELQEVVLAFARAYEQ
jgi:hypothetical protein